MIKYLIVLLSMLIYGCVYHRMPSQKELQEYDRLMGVGVISMRKGNLDEASAAFEVAEEIQQGASSIDGLGCIAFLKGDLLTAEQRFITALRRDPSYFRALGNLALLYQVAGRGELARQLYVRAINTAPTDERGRHNFGAFLASQGLLESAKAEVLRARMIADTPLIEDTLRRLHYENSKESSTKN